MKFNLLCVIILFGYIVECHQISIAKFKSALYTRSRGRILNGFPATSSGQFPYQVSVIGITKNNKQAMCGGSIIAPQWILTAAHCVYGNYLFYIGIGSTLLSTPNVTKTSNTSFIHPNYNDTTLQYDCALIKVSNITFNSNTKSVSLPSLIGTQTYSYLLGTISGWGLKDNTTISNSLLFLNVTTMSNSKCAEVYGPIIISSMMCAIGPINQLRDVCNGDSGGPLVIYVNQVAIQIGVISFTAVNGCASGYPSGYSRVTYFLSWIGQTTGIALS